MITNTGQAILAKYLVGQAPAYASYIAIGCGAKPVSKLAFSVTKKLASTTKATLTVPTHKFIVGSRVYVSGVDIRLNGSHNVTEVTTNTVSFAYTGVAITQEDLSPNGTMSYSFDNKERLDFEMFRVPITSRGYVNENNINKIVFTAELPTLERYEITEVGVYSAGSNPSAGSNDSRTIFSFSSEENWQYHGTGQPASIPSYEAELNSGNNVINKTEIAFQTNANNPIFTTSKREARGERCRFLNNMVAIRGDMSTINVLSDGKLQIASGNHIHLTGASLDFDNASPLDDIRLAFSLINKEGESDVQPDEIRIMLEFAQGDVHNTGLDPENTSQYARFETVIKDSDLDVDFATGRYFVSVKKFEELTKSPGFTWNVVNVVKFYVSVIKDGAVSDDYYVCLDALRLENTTSSNPLYGLTGYSIIKNTESKPIIKLPNTTNHIEFRFGLDVV